MKTLIQLVVTASLSTTVWGNGSQDVARRATDSISVRSVSPGDAAFLQQKVEAVRQWLSGLPGEVVLHNAEPLPEDQPRPVLHYTYRASRGFISVDPDPIAIIQRTADLSDPDGWSDVGFGRVTIRNLQGENYFLRGLAAIEPVPVYVPSTYDPDEPAGLKIGFHPYTGGPDTFSRNAGHRKLAEAAEERGELLALPMRLGRDGLNYSYWGTSPGSCPSFGENQRQDDLEWSGKLIQGLIDRFNVNRKHVVVYGLSDGACHAVECALKFSGLVTHAVIVSGRRDEGQNALPVPADYQPVNFLSLAGNPDPVMPYQGGTSMAGALVNSALDSTKLLAAINGCTEDIEEGQVLSLNRADDTEVLNCVGAPQGGAVSLYTVIGGGHNVALNETADENYMRLINDWIDRHPRP